MEAPHVHSQLVHELKVGMHGLEGAFHGIQGRVIPGPPLV